MKPAVFFIVGPTAVGKSEIAAEVASRCGGEVVGADAFQIYEGMPTLTAKPGRDVLMKAPHHLVGVVPLARSFDVAQYLETAARCIEEIASRGRLPIVCGGTGLYVRALTRGISDLPAADAEIRTRLEAMDLEELQRRYFELDPAGAGRIDSKNKRRLIRALEVCELTGKPFSSFRDKWDQPQESASGVVLTRDRDDLRDRIDRRVEEMFRSGLAKEVQALAEVGPTASQAIGLGEVRALLAGKISETECVAQIQQATRRYAKRQLTWFRRESAFETLNLSTFADSKAVVRLLVEKAEAHFHANSWVPVSHEPDFSKARKKDS